MRLLRILWIVLLGLCAPAVVAPALVTPAAAESRLVRIEGKRFIAPDGRVLHLKGINLGNWLVPEGYMFKFDKARAPRQIYGAFDRLLGPERAAAFWTEFRDRYLVEEDLRFIASLGFNTVRIPLHWRLLMTEDGKMEGEGWALLDRMLGWVGAAGLYAVVDLHAVPGGQTGINHDDGPGYPLMFYVPRYRALSIKLWGAIAQRYAGNPTILGYDLLNEPIAPNHDVTTLNPRLEPFYKKVTAAIRAVDPGRIIFLASGQWSSTFSSFEPPFADNLAYTYHTFWSSTKRDAVQRHLNFSYRYNVPLFLGETGELNDEWNAEIRELHERLGIGWSFWAYKNLDTDSTVVSIPRPEGWNEIVAFADGTRAEKPSPGTIELALVQYLDGMRLRNAKIQWSYIASLGLKTKPEP